MGALKNESAYVKNDCSKTKFVLEQSFLAHFSAFLAHYAFMYKMINKTNALMCFNNAYTNPHKDCTHVYKLTVK